MGPDPRSVKRAANGAGPPGSGAETARREALIRPFRGSVETSEDARLQEQDDERAGEP